MKKRKLGKCQKTGQDNARIWIENKKLAEYGFVPGAVFVTEPSAFARKAIKLCLVEDDDIVWGEPHTVCKKGNKSVIDLTGWWIKDLFDGCTHYTAAYDQGCIRLEGHNE